MYTVHEKSLIKNLKMYSVKDDSELRSGFDVLIELKL